MPTLDTLVLLRSIYHQPCGIASVRVLVEAAADAGYGAAALIDEGTLEGMPAFFEACKKFSIRPVPGMTVSVHSGGSVRDETPFDVFSLGEPEPGSGEIPVREQVTLLALGKTGYDSLLDLRRRLADRNRLEVSDLLCRRENLFLVVGLPGTLFFEVVEGVRKWDRISWMVRLLEGWPRRRIAFGGTYAGDDEAAMLGRLNRLKRLSLKTSLPPIPVVVSLYRNQSERFWGCARHLKEGSNLFSTHASSSFLVESRNLVRKSLQGIFRPNRLLERIVSKESDLTDLLRCTLPVYPTPRGTDLPSLFWTLAQETAIATGHLRLPGAKERLYEEFQFLKQTHWPLICVLLWDIRKRLGLPPGTVRPDSEWVTKSLFAHLLGLTRVDPLREKISFHPEGVSTNPGRGKIVPVLLPAGWGDQVLRELRSLFGVSHVKVSAPSLLPAREDLRVAGEELLLLWEDLGFPGDRPGEVPPFPSSLPERRDDPDRFSNTFLVSGSNLDRVFGGDGEEGFRCGVDEKNAAAAGCLVLRCRSPESQTLAAAPRYRGRASRRSHPPTRSESLSEWIETHRGIPFTGEDYADDAGHLEVLGISSSLLRLFTLPASSGYRPQLSWWCFNVEPSNLGELADLLALNWHTTFWFQRPRYKTLLARRDHPLQNREKTPPWWQDWERFREQSGLGSRSAGALSACLESKTVSTGGWILYHHQLVGAVREAFGFSDEEAELWIGPEEIPDKKTFRVSGHGNGLWDPAVRKVFRVFLGNPNPLPRREHFLRRAEELLLKADAFSEDPAAFVSLCSLLFPDESRERREVYSLLRTRKVRLSLPQLPLDLPVDTSPEKGLLTVGLLNIVGIGPNNVSPLLDLPEPEADPIDPNRLFRIPPKKTETTWKEWLESHIVHRAGWQELAALIELGICDGFGLSRERLVAEARSFLNRKKGVSAYVQKTLFSIDTPTEEVAAGERRIWERAFDPSVSAAVSQVEHLRYGVTRSPLEILEERIPENWKRADFMGKMLENGLLVGWIHEIDLFGIPEETQPTSEGGSCRATCLLINDHGAYRLEDTIGELIALLPPNLTAPRRPEGRRIHLGSPSIVLCSVRLHPGSSGRTRGLYSVDRVEDLKKASERIEEWDSISVVLETSLSDLPARLEPLLNCFRTDSKGSGVPLSMESVHRNFRFSGVRRLKRRFGSVRLFPSEVLNHRLRQIEGVCDAILIPRQKPLFGRQRENSHPPRFPP